MIRGFPGVPGRRHPWRIGRLVGGLAAVIAVLAGVAAFASAQPTTRVANPNLEQKCGLKVALVLDESASIGTAPGGFNVTADVRDAARGFVTAFEGTGSPVALTAFHSIGRLGVPYDVIDSGNVDTFLNWIGTGSGPNPTPSGYFPPTSVSVSNTSLNSPNGTTNWQDGFEQVRDQNRTPGGPPDLVVFVTDGNPNTVGSPPRPAVSTANQGPVDGSGRTRYISDDTAGRNAATNVAVGVANQLKTAGTRIFGIGVGPDVQGVESANRLAAVTGPREGTNPITDDYALVANFADLRAELTRIVAALCGGQVIITKHVLDHTGAPVQNASGWTFETTLSGAPHHWVTPDRATDGTPNGHTARLTTNGNGQAHFAWKLAAPDDKVNVSVQEIRRPGFNFVVDTCQKEGIDGPIGPPVTDAAEFPSGVELGREQFLTCEVTNRQHAANLTVVKRLVPPDDPGRFNLSIATASGTHVAGLENAGNEGTLSPDGSLPLGTYTVSETPGIQEDGTATDLSHYDTSISCVDLANNQHVVVPPHMGTSVSVPLTTDGQDIQCTISNISNRFGQITVVKHLIPEGDPGRFNLHIGSEVTPHPVGDAGELSDRFPFGTHEITETGANGTDLAHYNIHTTCVDENTGDELPGNPHGPDVSVDLTEQHNRIQCTITNERPAVKVGRLEVIKHLLPHDDAGLFDLLIGGEAFAVDVGHNGSTGPLDFELGAHTVTERAAGRSDLSHFEISTSCVDKAHGGHQVAHNAHGPSVTVHLNSEADDIVCTITNTRIQPPPEGGGTIPGQPGAHLAIVKTMPPESRVGELVPISITVHNHGRGAAHGVQLHEDRPPGLQIVHVANGGTIQHGTAVWHLGTLAPGASRTVHATARVVHTGRHVDTAVATALNADPALSNAAVRATTAARRPPPPPPPPPPPFTG